MLFSNIINVSVTNLKGIEIAELKAGEDTAYGLVIKKRAIFIFLRHHKFKAKLIYVVLEGIKSRNV